ncbi:MAG: LOW QUALITY PROTEIN: WD40-repeat-containing domain protein [Olpidium bornovanus]|uniref:WD40-repeat-containing domain protein n=1 Tax=Olpidium bornovanus TaxID=278681 RepID=A0A8H7ZMF0_9FUNG|nr:MAG: LOW QUALITY PROTEIN: WD40-repeat-containing domain protein [Olpidium bornovanus]
MQVSISPDICAASGRGRGKEFAPAKLTTLTWSATFQRLNDVAFNDDAVVIASVCLIAQRFRRRGYSASYDATLISLEESGITRQQGSQAIQVLDEAKDSVSSVVIRGHEIFTGSVDDRVRTYDIRMGEVKTDFVGGRHVALALERRKLFVDQHAGRHDTTYRQGEWHATERVRRMKQAKKRLSLEQDLLTRALDNRFKGHRNCNYKVQSCFNDSDSYVISGSEDREVYIWDLLEGAIVRQLDGHNHVVISTAHHPKSAEMLTGAGDGEIRLWTAREK